ncbi:MAG: VOC family protein [Azospirillaceae bacterium]
MTQTPSADRLHHFAWRCRDAEETRHFYEDVLGLPLAHVIKADKVPSTGEETPYVHIFFRMKDGSYIAFFDLGDGKISTPDPGTPSWVNHFAMEVESEDDLLAAKRRLEADGVAVIGPTDHGFVRSIYFFDPNGLRLEFTYRTEGPAYLDAAEAEAHAKLDAWTASRRKS